MKKRPSKVPISAIGPLMPSSVWRRTTWPQIAAAKREDMPGTASKPSAR